MNVVPGDKRMYKSKKIKTTALLMFCMICSVVLICIAENRILEQERLPYVDIPETKPEIIFVPGYKTQNIPEDEYLNPLKKVFPESTITIKKWNSNGAFSDWHGSVINCAEGVANELVDIIEQKPEKKQQNLILIGHSLGGRIVIRALAKLRDKNIRIRRGIFLAAAIQDDDGDIEKALYSTRRPCINIYNRNDYVLRNAYGIAGEKSFLDCALGAYGSRKHYPQMLLMEFQVQNSERISQIERYKNHDSLLYIEELEKRIHDDELHELLFPPSKILTLSIGKQDQWKQVEAEKGWQLCKHESINQYQILSPKGDVLIINDESIVKPLYHCVVEELRAAERHEAIEREIIIKFNDEPIKVLPYEKRWETDDSVNGWLLQHNKRGDRYRIVDSRDIMRANGSIKEMKLCFKAIKQLFEQKR